MKALVTGATGGVGRALLPLLVEQGYDVYAQWHRQEPEDVPGVTWFNDSAALRGFDALAAAIYLAGVCDLNNLEDTTREEWDRAFDVNVTQPALLTNKLLPALRAAGGHVIYVNSGSGLTAKAGWGTYCASKFAAKAWCDTLRQEEPTLRVTSIHPGRINTPMQQKIVAAEGGTYDGAKFIQPETVTTAIMGALATTPDATPTEIMIRPRPNGHDGPSNAGLGK
ncbi:SDR family oxidoreductase [Corynebacterium pyruviciproducens]|uniref:SDR family oxidoreductase n=1 Tax=Corynebacterium pyruviciproducens TaxID=598660 RepID=UPI00254D8721|nr:SDR family oxidoreductase [Corynebacterium pyruviciproducens]MDK7215407.1 SDR family oxidoreductase [Corynebacterium pyruviciproducens]